MCCNSLSRLFALYLDRIYVKWYEDEPGATNPIDGDIIWTFSWRILNAFQLLMLLYPDFEDVNAREIEFNWGDLQVNAIQSRCFAANRTYRDWKCTQIYGGNYSSTPLHFLRDIPPEGMVWKRKTSTEVATALANARN